jgi:arabinofuranosyltransferase
VDKTRFSRPLVLLAAGGVLALQLWHASFWLAPVDDAFISFRYVQNLVDGVGLVYNPGEHVEGYSNLLWVLMLAVPAALGANLPSAALFLGMMVAIATLAVVYAAGRRVLVLDRIPALSGAVFLAASGFWSYWAGAGLETCLFALLITLLWWSCHSELRSRRLGVALIFLLAALLALCRPEGVAAFPVLLVVLGRDRRVDRRALLLGALAFVVPEITHLGFRLYYYGSLVPNVFHVKVDPDGRLVWRGLRYLGSALTDENLLYLAPILALAGLPRQRRRAVASLLVPLSVYVVFILVVGGDGLIKARFVAHVAPLLALGIAAGLQAIGTARPLLAAAAAAWVTLVVALPSQRAEIEPGVSLSLFRQNLDRWDAVGRQIAALTPPQTIIATTNAGRVAYYAHRTTIDMLGLCDATIAHTALTDGPRRLAGHERANPQYLMRRGPDIIYSSLLDGSAPEFIVDATAVGTRLFRSPFFRYAPLLANPEFLASYRPARLRLARDQWADVLIRAGGNTTGMPPSALEVLSWR